jgi:Flp pilus assembly protein TadG
MATVSTQAAQRSRTRRFLTELARSTSGNSMILVAAAMVPIAGMVGGGFDMGRAYLAKSKLQSACDAGALAGRRTMVGTTWNAASTAAANAYFGVNFVVGKYGTAGLVRTFTSADGRTVTGTASVNVPTTLMKILGYNNVPVNVSCEAVMNLPNTDVMFVLDTTGSMASINPGDTQSRMVGMRTTIMNFYDTVELAKSVGTQVRYGFVPYSSNVNVGTLLKNDWVVDNATYQSREPAGASTSVSTTDEYNWLGWSNIVNPYTVYTSVIPGEVCAPTGTHTLTGLSWAEDTTIPRAPDPVTGLTIVYFKEVLTGSDFQVNVDPATGICTQTEYRYANSEYRHRYEVIPAGTSTTSNSWIYRPVNYVVSGLKDPSGYMGLGVVPAQVGSGQTTIAVNWHGCIEERATTTSTNYSLPLTTTLKDLDVDSIPNPADPTTQWRPHLPGLVFPRQSDSNLTAAAWPTKTDLQSYELAENGKKAACPGVSRKLTEYNSTTPGKRQNLSDYLAGLMPEGLTHHDIGMIWGLRLMSPNGLFGTENATTPSGGQITRHLVLMTDGETNALVKEYDTYGLAGLDQRRYTIPSGETQSASDTATNSLVEGRFAAMCNVAKAKNITVWVIAFGTSLTPMLTSCATDPSNAFQAGTTAALNTAFTEIAAKIANLRLRQ